MSLDKDKRNLNQCPLKYFVENTNKIIKFKVLMATGVLPEGLAVVGFTLDRARIHAASLARYSENLKTALFFRVVNPEEEEEPVVIPGEAVKIYRGIDPYNLMYMENDGTFEYSENGLLPEHMQESAGLFAGWGDDEVYLFLADLARFVEGQLNQYDKVHIKRLIAYTANGFLANEVNVININDSSNVRKYAIDNTGGCDIDLDVRNEVLEIDTTIATQENELFDESDMLNIMIGIDKVKGVLF